MTQERREQEPTSSSKTPGEIARDTPKYALTEFITLKFRQGVHIEEDTTNEGRIWANTMKTYIEQDGVDIVWWGRTFEEQDTVKLLVELDLPTQNVCCGIYKASVS